MIIFGPYYDCNGRYSFDFYDTGAIIKNNTDHISFMLNINNYNKYWYNKTWYNAPTQLTANISDLFPGKVALGKDGIIEGDGSIYDQINILEYLKSKNTDNRYQNISSALTYVMRSNSAIHKKLVDNQIYSVIEKPETDSNYELLIPDFKAKYYSTNGLNLQNVYNQKIYIEIIEKYVVIYYVENNMLKFFIYDNNINDVVLSSNISNITTNIQKLNCKVVSDILYMYASNKNDETINIFIKVDLENKTVNSFIKDLSSYINKVSNFSESSYERVDNIWVKNNKILLCRYKINNNNVQPCILSCDMSNGTINVETIITPYSTNNRAMSGIGYIFDLDNNTKFRWLYDRTAKKMLFIKYTLSDLQISCTILDYAYTYTSDQTMTIYKKDNKLYFGITMGIVYDLDAKTYEKVESFDTSDAIKIQAFNTYNYSTYENSMINTWYNQTTAFHTVNFVMLKNKNYTTEEINYTKGYYDDYNNKFYYRTVNGEIEVYNLVKLNNFDIVPGIHPNYELLLTYMTSNNMFALINSKYDINNEEE